MHEMVTLSTDHSSSHWLLTIQYSSGRIIRLRRRLGDSDFEVKYERQWKYENKFLIIFKHHEWNYLSWGFLLQSWNQLELKKLLQAHLYDSFCSEVRHKLYQGGNSMSRNRLKWLFVRRSFMAMQSFAPHSVQERILYINHHSHLVGNQDVGSWITKSERISIQHHWYTAVLIFPHCERNWLKLRMNLKLLQIFPAEDALKSVSIDIIVPFILKSQKNVHLLLITDQFCKVPKTIPMTIIPAAEFAKNLVNHLVFMYGTSKNLVVDYSRCVMPKSFQNICRIIFINRTFTTAYHPKTNRKVERYNPTILAAQRT